MQDHPDLVTTDVTLEDIMTRVNAGRKGSLAGQCLGQQNCVLQGILCVGRAQEGSSLDGLLYPFALHIAADHPVVGSCSISVAHS